MVTVKSGVDIWLAISLTPSPDTSNSERSLSAAASTPIARTPYLWFAEMIVDPGLVSWVLFEIRQNTLAMPVVFADWTGIKIVLDIALAVAGRSST